MLRKKLFGGYSDQEMAEEHTAWRKGIHDDRGAKQESIAKAYYNKKASDKAFAVAEEAAKILSGDLEVQKRISDRIDRSKAKNKNRNRDEGKDVGSDPIHH
jgi:hypothetical protein